MNVLTTFILGHLSNMNFSKNFELERNTAQVLSKKIRYNIFCNMYAFKLEAVLKMIV